MQIITQIIKYSQNFLTLFSLKFKDLKFYLFNKHFNKIFLITLSSLLFSGCTKKIDLDEKKNISSDELYDLGMKEFHEEQYQYAAIYFKSIFEKHPTDEKIYKSEIMYAYSLYLNGQYQDAIDVYSNFLIYFPNNSNNDYIRYMIFLSNYNQISDVSRDQNKTFNTFLAFEDLKSYVPKHSKYYIDASKKILIVYDYLAAEQMTIGLNRLKEKNPIAAILKFKQALPYKSIHSAQALYRIVESCTMLNLEAQAAKYFGILQHNFPHSIWYTDGLENFKNQTWFIKYSEYIKKYNKK